MTILIATAAVTVLIMSLLFGLAYVLRNMGRRKLEPAGGRAREATQGDR